MANKWVTGLRTGRLIGIGAAVITVAIGAGVHAYYSGRDDAGSTVVTARVTQGDIVNRVTATGTVQAVTTVQVGTQVSGTIAWLGADFNSMVKKGQVIARLDTSLIDAQLQQSRATLARTMADVENAQVQVADAQQKHARAQTLAERQLIARSDLDAATVAVNVAEAQLKAAQAQVMQSQAVVHQNEVNRGNTVITAPIDGIVIQRSVDVGQTVAASLSSPTIFSIAADLTEMQIQANVDESDIGIIAAGQPVTFTVDAYPNEPFSGTVTQVRLQPTVVQNVTTYTVIVDVPNRDLKLKPGMTTTAEIEVARRDDVLRVPNAALRFTPTETSLAALGLSSRPQRAGGNRVWVKGDPGARPVDLQAGLSDGQVTEVVSGSLKAGDEVITNVASATASARPAASPLSNVGIFGGPPAGGFGGGRSGSR